MTTVPLVVRSGDDILTEIQSFGLKKVTEMDATGTHGLIYKTCGWRKRSIFWNLPYWRSNLIRHNLDVMHIEKIVFDNVFNTVLNVDGKKKGHFKIKTRVE